MKIYSLMNVKGGVGKSLTAECLARGFASTGLRTLAIDADGQGDLTQALLPNYDFDTDDTISDKTLSSCLTGKKTIQECIWRTDFENLDIVPANMDLFNTVYEIQGKGGADFFLSKLIHTIDYDCVIIDNNPSVNKMTFNAIYASDVIICPTNIGKRTLKGVSNTRKVCVEAIKSLPYIKPLEFTLLLTMIGRNKNSKEGEEQLRKAYGNEVLDTIIRYQQKPVQDAEFARHSLLDDPKSGVADDYRHMVEEVLRKGDWTC